MEEINVNFKQEKINELREAQIKQDYQKSFEIALDLVDFCEKNLVSTDDYADLVEAYSIANRQLKAYKPLTNSNRFCIKMLEILKSLDNDIEWQIRKYEEILLDLSIIGRLQDSYDVLLKLLSLYKKQNNRTSIEKTYARLLALFNNTLEDIVNYIEKAENFDVTQILKNQTNYKKHLRRDPIELSSKYNEVYPDIEKTIHKEIGEPGQMGYVYGFWSKLKEELNEKHNLDWVSPAILNNAKFD